MSATNIPSACKIANIIQKDAMILPYDANPGPMEVSERTGDDFTLRRESVPDIIFGKDRFPLLCPAAFSATKFLRIVTTNSAHYFSNPSSFRLNPHIHFVRRANSDWTKRVVPMTDEKRDPNSKLTQHERWLRRLVELALEGSRAGHGRPFGAVIVRDGNLVAEAHNEVIRQNDPTAHAEILVICRAAAALGSRDLSGCDVYVNGMPCPMCYSAMYWSGLRDLLRVHRGALAKIIGIDDAELYADLALPPAQRRKLPAEQVTSVLGEAIGATKHGAIAAIHGALCRNRESYTDHAVRESRPP